MSYSVRFVADEELPPDHDWALARDEAGHYYAFIKQSSLVPRVLEEAWAGYRALSRKLSLVA